MALEIALVTCEAVRELDPDDRLLIPPLVDFGVTVAATVWDDPSVAWDQFNLSIVRSTWDYTSRRDAFVAWARSVPNLVNSAAVIEWNTDKVYLRELERAGVPVVPTSWLSPADPVELPSGGAHVIKPSIGAGSMRAELFDLDADLHRERARRHVQDLLTDGLTAMVQPFQATIEASGETGVMFCGGRFSHGISKALMLQPGVKDEVEGVYRTETIDAREPSAAEIEVATAALDVSARILGLSGREAFAYARVDLVPDGYGRPQLMEVELTEPSLFFRTAPGSAARFAEEFARRATDK